LENFASIAIISTIAISLINSEKKLFVSVALVAVSIGYHSGKAGMMAVISGNEISSGYGGPFPDNNGFALAAAVIVPLLVICLMTNRLSGKSKVTTNVIYAMLAIGSCLTVIKTGSRGASVALAVGILLFMILEKPKSHLLYIILLVIGVYSFSDLIFTEEYMNRMQTILNYRDIGEQSAISRLHFWAVAERVLVNNPLGVGFFNFGYAYDIYDTTDGLYGRTRPVHNTHLQILTEGGLIGAFGWAIALLGAILQNLKIIIMERAEENSNIRLNRAYSKGIVISIVVFIIGSSFGNYAYNELIWTLLAISCANALNYQERIAFQDPTSQDLMTANMMK
jgi:O-antigen ligase